MESHVVNLQDKIQKLIDQYTLDKTKLAELEEQSRQLKEENSQLLSQIEAYGKTTGDQDAKYQTLKEEYTNLEIRYNEMQKMLSGFESIAESAINKIDNIFPLVTNKD